MSIDTMVAAAERTLGTSGRPNYITTDYASRDGSEFAAAPWCDEGVTYWARQSGEYNAVCFGTDYAYTVAHAARFDQAGQWHPGADGIARGDIVFFSWSGGTTIDSIEHVGIVTGTSGGYVYTVEANTSDSVARRVRSAGVIVGYGRPQYTDAPATPAAPAWPGRVLVSTSPMIHGDDVRTWQQQMRTRGWSITADGWYGPASAAVARAFQQDKGLTPDAEVGPITWAAAWTAPVT
ncbi:hypothetical protein GCM10009760_18410 [Kitasatospora kazusensis]|uniref:CHAP domain-containing protein n=1 Tax=Kitasatospora kazusensis TaxID=407974 RepID=A0ABN2Z6Y6_9ACTN